MNDDDGGDSSCPVPIDRTIAVMLVQTGIVMRMQKGSCHGQDSALTNDCVEWVFVLIARGCMQAESDCTAHPVAHVASLVLLYELLVEIS